MSVKPPAPFNVFIDSDGPVADFGKALKASGLPADEFKHLPGVYLYLDVTEGARDALEWLKTLDDEEKLRVWILTKTPSHSPYAYTEKVLWYRQNFPWLEDRVILAHDKSLVGSENDFLLDDRPHKGNAELFRGQFVLFEENWPTSSWVIFRKYVMNKLYGPVNYVTDSIPQG
jgi:5'(3')-deoxyribonucleotidase